MKNKTIKNKKKVMRGGMTKETNDKFYDYAKRIQNKSPIDINEFRIFLDSVKDPLFQEFQFNEDSNEKYTINEWAFLHQSPHELQLVFQRYPVSLTHTFVYTPFFYASDVRHTILEAYIHSSSNYTLIKSILSQLKTDDDVENSLFRFSSPTIFLPTALYYAFYSRNYKVDGKQIFRLIFNKYTEPDIFDKLLEYTPNAIKILFDNSIIMNNPDALYLLLDNNNVDRHTLVPLLFQNDYMEVILLNDNIEMYETLINAINKIDESIISELVCRLLKTKASCESETLKKILQYKNHNAVKFFKKLGNYAIDTLTAPAVSDHPKIIIVSHGITYNQDTINIEFPFGKLCFYAHKGQTLQNNCILSKTIPELICAGNYDGDLKCKNSDGTMAIDNLALSFVPDKLNFSRIFGIYTCYRNKIVNITDSVINDCPKIDGTQLYHIGHILYSLRKTYHTHFSSICPIQYIEILAHCCCTNIGEDVTESKLSIIIPRVQKQSPESPI